MKYLMQKVGLQYLCTKLFFNRSFNANPTDIRTKESFIIAKDAGGNEIGIFDNKMKGTKTEGDRTYDSDIIIYRLAEMYLFKAEAYAALNQTPQAIIELNKVRIVLR